MSDRQTYSLWQQLRRQYPRFTYSSYQWKIVDQSVNCTFKYVLGKHTLVHTISFELGTHSISDAQLEGVNSLVLYLGMMEGISYWKLACSPEICVEAGQFSVAELNWWHGIILNGMGEYFYVNDIAFTKPGFLKLVCEDLGAEVSASTAATLAAPELKSDQLDQFQQRNTGKTLVGVGGGKDSIVSIELLKQHFSDQAGKQLGLLLINPTQAAREVAALSGLSTVHVVQRSFDPLLFVLNTQDFLNGHVPISATFALIGLLMSHIFQYDSIAISNERSSNEGNVEFHGIEINHQWSKSFYFEHSFQTQMQSLSLQPVYYSLLRPLYELQIAQIFSKVGTAYFSSFRSCNRGSKRNIWCGECSKCLFAYILLLPFWGIEHVSHLFGKDLLADLSLEETALELIGKGKNKPLDCVGMFEESAVAFELCARKYREQNISLPVLLEQLITHVSQIFTPTLEKEFLHGWNEQHAVPKKLLALLNRPQQF